ncbi:effector-associated constant component EACC1 [Actinomadura luzonensis]|uniref:effector-associated constant component EACC1 n=1 Tax=Actinomadura luzonensis TaxID=2805427 RepID=UPI00389920A5
MDDLVSLTTWLQSQRELQGRIRPVTRPPDSEELGGAVDLLTVALGSGGALGMVLARALTTWLTNRRSDVSLTITTLTGSVTVEAKRVSDPLPLLQEVLQHEAGHHDSP